jgi:tRNA G18 (ribose-2'-O)-methylase SpoU
VRIERVDDPADPRLRDFTDLRDVQLRSLREPEEGLFLAEGERTIRRALAAGYRPLAALSAERWLPALADALGDVDVPAYVVDEEVLRSTTGYPVHRGALASFARTPPLPPHVVLLEARRVVVLEDLVDHTNVGAIFRSAAALGWDAVLLTPRAADPLYRRSVRTSMGAVFRLPWTRIDHREGPGILHDAGLTTWALTPDGERSIDEAGPPERLALVLGAEDPGVSARWRDAVEARVRIPMVPAVDSLNVAAAAAIALFALGPRR